MKTRAPGPRGELDRAVHGAGELARDREPEAAAGRAAPVAAVEALEDLHARARGDARAVVLDVERGTAAVVAPSRTSTCVPGGVWTQRVLDQRPADLQDVLLVAERRGRVRRADLEQLVRRARPRPELRRRELGQLRRGRPAPPRPAAGRRRAARGRAGRSRASSAASTCSRICARGTRRAVASSSSSSSSSSRKPAEREERRPQLVGRVGDELAPRVLELREAQAHAFEGARELAELVGAVVDDRLVELAVRDAFGRPLEPTDPPREEPCARVPRSDAAASAKRAGDEQTMLDELDARAASPAIEVETRKTIPVRQGWAASAYRRSPPVTTPARSRALVAAVSATRESVCEPVGPRSCPCRAQRQRRAVVDA